MVYLCPKMERSFDEYVSFVDETLRKGQSYLIPFV